MAQQPRKILRVDSSSRTETSVSRKLTQRIIDRFLDKDADVIVKNRNLSQGMNTITEDWITANFTPAENRSEEQVKTLELSESLVAELKEADTIVIGLPIYNFSVPASMKAWIDQIARVGETFYYTEDGPVGMLENKRAIVAVASDGVPFGSPMDYATNYLTHMLGFLGITDVSYVAATGIAFDPDNAVNAAEQQIDDLQLAA